MTKEEYAEQLKSPRWIKKKMRILNRDQFRCVKCMSTDFLQVHHLYYITGEPAWGVPDLALVTLCNKCHKQWHEYNILVFKNKPAKCKSKGKVIEYSAPKKPLKPRSKKGKLRDKKKKSWVFGRILPDRLKNCNIPSRLHSEVRKEYKHVHNQAKIEFIKSLYLQYGKINEDL
jgi:hypothetical protein